MDALKLAGKVKAIIAKHIQAKGYETDAVLKTPAADVENRDELSITDEGQPDPHAETVRIVVTAHDIEENAMELGDNPAEVLEFIVIEDGTEPDARQVKEGRLLGYDGKEFEIKLAAPATLAGQLIIKECRAERVK
jgi:hypothetical protein